MLIGHNPGIQDLALGLAASGPARTALREKFPVVPAEGSSKAIPSSPSESGCATNLTRFG
jgi:phosphohistidine phosphatase SixA